MKTLEHHNAIAIQYHTDFNKPRSNGIECPDCKGELIDSTPNMVLASDPPQLNVHCDKCGFTGYRFA